MPHQPADAGVPQLTVELRDVGKSFGGLPVLRHIDLTIRPGTVHALVGDPAPVRLSGAMPGTDNKKPI